MDSIWLRVIAEPRNYPWKPFASGFYAVSDNEWWHILLLGGKKNINFLHYNPFLLPTSFCFQVSSLVMLNHDLGREVAITGNQVLQAQADPCSFDLEPILRRWTAHKEHRSTAISRKGQVTSAAISGAQTRGCREGRETFQRSKGMM